MSQEYPSFSKENMESNHGYEITVPANQKYHFGSDYEQNEAPRSTKLHVVVENSSGKVIQFCGVCGDKSSGNHYGVLTCEGCKAFFRRCRKPGSTEQFKCQHLETCNITTVTRNRCQYCRFKKCLEIGMQFDAAPRSHTQKNTLIKDPRFISVMPEKMAKIIEKHQNSCAFTQDKMKVMVLKDYEPGYDPQDDPFISRVRAWQTYSKEMEREIGPLASFIQGLDDPFNPAHRACILKKQAFPIHLLRSTRGISPCGMILSDGRIISLDTLRLLYGIELAEEMVRLAGRIINLGFTDDDIAMFITMVYYQPLNMEAQNEMGFDRIQELTAIQDEYKSMFIQYHKGNSGKFLQMMDLIPKINELNERHTEVLKFLTAYRQFFKQQQVFTELFISSFDSVKKPQIEPKMIQNEQETEQYEQYTGPNY